MLQEFIDTIYLQLQDLYAALAGKFVLVVLVFMFGMVISSIIASFAASIIREMPFEKYLKEHLQLKKYPSETVEKVVQLALNVIVFIIVLGILELTTFAFYSLAIVAIIVVVVYVLLNLKDLGPNTYAYYRLVEDFKLKKGDKLKIQGTTLTFVKCNNIDCFCKTPSGDFVSVSNRSVLEELENQSTKKRKKKKNTKKK